MTSLSILFLTVETFDDRAPQFVCEMSPEGWTEGEPALITTWTDLN